MSNYFDSLNINPSTWLHGRELTESEHGVLAVIIEQTHGVTKNAHTLQLCAACACQRFSCTNRQLADVLSTIPSSVATITLAYADSEGMPLDDLAAQKTFSERCDVCKQKLAPWVECLCGDVSWPEQSHTCAIQWQNPELWKDFLNGVASLDVEG